MKVVFFANTAWYLYNFRLGFAKFLREQNFDVIMMSPDGPCAARLQAEGFRWKPLTMDRRSMHPGREFAVLRQISAVYAAEKPDIVHHFTIKCVIYGSLVAWWHDIEHRINAVAGMGYVFTSQEFRARVLRPFVRSLIRSVVAGKHARIVLQNTDDYVAFRNTAFAARANVRLIRGSGVDTELFRPPQARLKRLVTRVLFAARLLWDKGLGEYVECARRLKETNSPIELLVAGMPDAGNPSSVLPAQVADWHEKGWITYLGHVDDMAGLLQTIDIAVLPSYREGAPRGLIEAAAAGVPIVTTNVPGCREIVDHGRNGLLVPARRVSELIEAIRYLHERPDERDRMGMAGREKALKEFDERIVFEQTLAVYRELLAYSVKMPKQQVQHA